MYPRTEYEMTEQDLETILNACKPVPYMVIGGVMPSSPQENANRAWSLLGERMGFLGDTVQPLEGKGMRFFSAIPKEPEEARQKRLLDIKEGELKALVAKLEAELRAKQAELQALLGEPPQES